MASVISSNASSSSTTPASEAPVGQVILDRVVQPPLPQVIYAIPRKDPSGSTKEDDYDVGNTRDIRKKKQITDDREHHHPDSEGIVLGWCEHCVCWCALCYCCCLKTLGSRTSPNTSVNVTCLASSST
eukprot:scaffold4412_cov91-Cylindrotheca_fusiformis.AAC.5